MLLKGKIEKIFRSKKKLSIKQEIKQQILDIVVISLIFLGAAFFGKCIMGQYRETWLCFNISALVFAGIGMFLWHFLRKKNYERYE